MNETEERPADAAAEAFEELRTEVALLRRAVEGLAASRDDAPAVPDYTETLGQIAKAAAGTARRVDVLAQAAERGTAPANLVDPIIHAGASAREEDRRLLASARQELRDATEQIGGYVESARLATTQTVWLIGTGLSGTIMGVLLWAALAGPIARAMPERWFWPERMAARILDRSPWAAAERLAAVSNPERWRAMVAAVQIVGGSQEAIDRCRNAATAAVRTVRCTIRLSPVRRAK